MTAHADLAGGRWLTLSLAQQLANVGSEVERALGARDAGRAERLARALERALELFDLTVGDARWAGARRREILRLREECCRVFFGADATAESARGLTGYFLHFGVLARRQRASGAPAPLGARLPPSAGLGPRYAPGSR